MVSYQYDSAIELADEAIRHARAVGDVVIEADAMVTSGVTRAGKGDRRAIEMLEEALALVGHSGRVASRAYTNLGSAWSMFADLRRASEASRAGVAVAERDGDEQSAWFMRANLLGLQYALGDWEAAVAALDALLDSPTTRSDQAAAGRQIRAVVLEARGSVDDASAELEGSVSLARPSGEPQALWPALIGVQEWHVELALELREAGLVDEGRTLVERMPDGRWRDACRSAADGDYVDAADRLASIGEVPLQMQLRMLAARSLTDSGRPAEAGAQLELARAFYRTVGATAFLAEADGIVATAS